MIRIKNLIPSSTGLHHNLPGMKLRKAYWIYCGNGFGAHTRSSLRSMARLSGLCGLSESRYSRTKRLECGRKTSQITRSGCFNWALTALMTRPFSFDTALPSCNWTGSRLWWCQRFMEVSIAMTKIPPRESPSRPVHGLFPAWNPPLLRRVNNPSFLIPIH